MRFDAGRKLCGDFFYEPELNKENSSKSTGTVFLTILNVRRRNLKSQLSFFLFMTIGSSAFFPFVRFNFLTFSLLTAWH